MSPHASPPVLDTLLLLHVFSVGLGTRRRLTTVRRNTDFALTINNIPPRHSAEGLEDLKEII
jgi:hypothetical protein